MENRSHALVTGVFILLLGAALLAVIAWFQGDHAERVAYTVVTRTGVPGLNIKAAVKLHGVPVGKVEEIAFDPENPRQILVTIEVDKAAPLTQATFARLGYQGITGLSFIELSDGDEADAGLPLRPDARIELRPSLIDQLSSSGPRLLAGVNEAALRVNRLLNDENLRQLSNTLANLGEASADVGHLVRALRPAAQALQPLLQRGDQLLQGAELTLQNLDGLATESTALARELRQRSQALDALGQAALQLQTTTKRLELALVGADKPRAQALVDQLGQAARAVERAAADLSEQPQSLVFGRPATAPGPGEAGFDANRKGP
jgi:phospholipid/cholesterol/gamma-HCH transport system substrate-binding protein